MEMRRSATKIRLRATEGLQLQRRGVKGQGRCIKGNETMLKWAVFALKGDK